MSCDHTVMTESLWEFNGSVVLNPWRQPELPLSSLPAAQVNLHILPGPAGLGGALHPQVCADSLGLTLLTKSPTSAILSEDQFYIRGSLNSFS